MPKNDKRKLQGSNQQILGLNREFAVGDRVAKLTLGGGLSLPNTPASKGTKRGIVISREKKSTRSSKAKSGKAWRWQCEVQWDGSERTDWVDEQRLIHEDELSKFTGDY